MVEPGGGPLPGGSHASHDPDVIASLLDRDLTDVERDSAERQVASCTSCATLLADMRALASATASLPIPRRTRDFRLTAAAVAEFGEPVTAATRQTVDMTDTRDLATHTTHDTLLVAALADRTIDAADRERAEALVARCGLCAALRDDLVAIRAATRAQPTPPRPRDYQLSADDAARLRPIGWRRLIAAIAGTGGFTRPLAVGLTTLGLAGLLVATVPSILNGPVALGPSSAALPESNAAGGRAPSGAAAALPAGGATAGDTGPGAGSAGFGAAPASAASDNTTVRAAAPPAPAAPSAASSAPSTVAPAIAHALSASASPAASGPAYDAVTASPGASVEPVAAAQATTPVTEDKGVPGSAAEPPQAAVATGDTTAAESAHAVAAASAPTLDQVAAKSEGSGPSALVVVSAGLLLAGLGLFAIRRLGRRPLD